MNMKEVHAIKFRLYFNDTFETTVYMTNEEFSKLHEEKNEWDSKDIDKIIPEYFTKDKIQKYKEELCRKIMESENPFSIHDCDLDMYNVDENLIWK